jgi:hypothetical protein
MAKDLVGFPDGNDPLNRVFRVAQEKALLELVGSKAAAQKSAHTTVAQRKDKLRQSLEDYDVDRLLELQQKMSSFIDILTGDSIATTNGGRVLDGTRAADLMKRFLDQRDIDELASVVRDLIKETVYGHIDALLEASDVEDPEAHNGSLEVPELGKKFCREGAGYKDPEFDTVRLKELLGDRAADIFDTEEVPEQIIPAHTEEVFSIEKALKLGQRDPAVMEILRDCLTPGALKSSRFVVRDL